VKIEASFEELGHLVRRFAKDDERLTRLANKIVRLRDRVAKLKKENKQLRAGPAKESEQC